MGSEDGISGCGDVIERIYGYLDGELTEDRRLAIKHHLDACPPCVAAYDFESELRQVIANRCRDRVPDALVQRVRAALDDEERRGSGVAAGD